MRNLFLTNVFVLKSVTETFLTNDGQVTMGIAQKLKNPQFYQINLVWHQNGLLNCINWLYPSKSYKIR